MSLLSIRVHFSSTAQSVLLLCSIPGSRPSAGTGDLVVPDPFGRQGKKYFSNRNGRKHTKTDINRHKLTKTYNNRQKRTETERNRQKWTETDR